MDITELFDALSTETGDDWRSTCEELEELGYSWESFHNYIEARNKEHAKLLSWNAM